MCLYRYTVFCIDLVLVHRSYCRLLYDTIFREDPSASGANDKLPIFRKSHLLRWQSANAYGHGAPRNSKPYTLHPKACEIVP